MFKLIGLTAASIFTAEALVMLFVESLGSQLSLPVRVLLDSTLLIICVFPTFYFLVFKEMSEQIRLRQLAEQAQRAGCENLESLVEDRTYRLQRANEDLLIEVQERAKAAMALRTALNETRKGKEQLQAVINAVNDALLVVDDKWQVLAVNRAAEIMFNVSSYDLLGKSLKKFLLPWSQGPADLDTFFSRQHNQEPTFLTPPEPISEERWPVQMRFGEELEWNDRSAMVVTFYYRSDLTGKTLQNKSLS